jgi:1-acyl-sn-glycerol-3-phosphate acyltransferase
MSDTVSPQARRDQATAILLVCLVCLALPTVALLVYNVPGDDATRRVPLIELAIGAFAGALVPFLYWSAYRAQGFVAYVAVAWLAAVAHGIYWNEWPGWVHGLTLGFIVSAVARVRHEAPKVEENYALIAAVLFGVGIGWGFVVAERPFDAAGYYLLALAVTLVVCGITRLFRQLFEITAEPWLWLMYRIRAAGPGVTALPRTGPCLVIANHACWFDPLFLEKVLPRPVTPMMTARFYDLPVIRQLVVAFGVIRVPEKAMKKSIPEVQDAIAALDRGECVVIFPEGYLRRNEDRPMRRFGQGVWQILQARPETPVFACWIEGAWGSYTSYYNGPPTKNKKKDFRRPISLGIAAAAIIPPEVLAEHLRTRIYLMNLVSAAREHINLPPLPHFELFTKDEEKPDEEKNIIE